MKPWTEARNNKYKDVNINSDILKFDSFSNKLVSISALDWGGVRREWFELVCYNLFNPEGSGLFRRFKEDNQGLVSSALWIFFNGNIHFIHCSLMFVSLTPERYDSDFNTWRPEKMADILQMTFSNLAEVCSRYFSGMIVIIVIIILIA